MSCTYVRGDLLDANPILREALDLILTIGVVLMRVGDLPRGLQRARFGSTWPSSQDADVDPFAMVLHPGEH